MPLNSFARLLYEIRLRAGKTHFEDNEAITVIRQVLGPGAISGVELELFTVSIDIRHRGPQYYVERPNLRRNYCTNPSFEYNLSGWTESIIGATGNSNITNETGDFDIGMAGLELSMTDSIGAGGIIRRAYVTESRLIAAGQTWSCGARVRIEELLNTRVVFKMEFLSANDSVLATYNSISETVAQGYVDISNSNQVAPATTAKIRTTVMLESMAVNANGKVQFDGIMIEKRANIGPIFDGDSQDGFWEGDLHASESLLDSDGDATIAGFFAAS